MKVVNIMSSKVLGGVEQAFLDYNEALSLNGYNVFAFYNKFGKIKDKLIKNDKVKYSPLFFLSPYIFLFPYYFLKIKNIKPDIIIIHSKKILPIFAKIGKLLKIPVVIVCHNEKIKLINKADYIFSITQFQKDIFIKNGFKENKIFVIPNLINFKKEFEEFDNFLNPPVFGTMGRFEPAKGLSTLIEACGILKNKGIDFKLKIAGSPQKQYINEYYKIKNLVERYNLQNNVEFLGWVANKNLFYDSINIFVMSSIHESFGIVLLEAMMYSKPIISSLAEGPREIFSDNQGALTFETENEQQLANLMEELVNNQKLAKKIAKNGYELVNKKYTIDNVSEKLKNVIESIL